MTPPLVATAGLATPAAEHCGANAKGGGGFRVGNTCASGGRDAPLDAGFYPPSFGNFGKALAWYDRRMMVIATEAKPGFEERLKKMSLQRQQLAEQYGLGDWASQTMAFREANKPPAEGNPAELVAGEPAAAPPAEAAVSPAEKAAEPAAKATPKPKSKPKPMEMTEVKPKPMEMTEVKPKPMEMTEVKPAVGTLGQPAAAAPGKPLSEAAGYAGREVAGATRREPAIDPTTKEGYALTLAAEKVDLSTAYAIDLSERMTTTSPSGAGVNAIVRVAAEVDPGIQKSLAHAAHNAKKVYSELLEDRSPEERAVIDRLASALEVAKDSQKSAVMYAAAAALINGLPPRMPSVPGDYKPPTRAALREAHAVGHALFAPGGDGPTGYRPPDAEPLTTGRNASADELTHALPWLADAKFYSSDPLTKLTGGEGVSVEHGKGLTMNGISPKTNAAAIKVSLAWRLGKRIAEASGGAFSEQQARSFAARTTSSWAASSGDDHPESVALQVAAAAHFGTELNVPTSSSDTLSKAQKVYAEKKAFYDAYVAESYKFTQEQFAAAGITHVTVARGMRSGAKAVGGRTRAVAISEQTLSSWSTSVTEAEGFAGSSPDSLVMADRIPVEQIFSTWATGPGCKSEREIVVVGRKSRAVLAYQGTARGIKSNTFTGGPSSLHVEGLAAAAKAKRAAHEKAMKAKANVKPKPKPKGSVMSMTKASESENPFW